MKKIKTLVVLICAFSFLSGYAADTTKTVLPGKMSVNVFTGFNSGATNAAGYKSSFNLSRAYLGYSQDLGNGASAVLKLDVGALDETTTSLKSYVFFKNAYLKYKFKNLTFNMGVIDALQFKFQYQAWGHRYLAKVMEDNAKYGSTADMGFSAEYKIKELSFDASVINGEGFTNLVNIDNTYKTTLGVTYIPIETLKIRGYFDYAKKTEIQNTFSSTIVYTGIKNTTIGINGALRINDNFKDNQTKYGHSVFILHDITKKIEIFGRYDNGMSTTITGSKHPWNYKKDGIALIGGFQYKLNDKVRCALNYQDNIGYYHPNKEKGFVYFNLEMNF